MYNNLKSDMKHLIWDYFCRLHLQGEKGTIPITELEYGQMGDLVQCGLQAVCSLSESFGIIVYRDGKEFRQDYIRGIAQHEVYEADSEHCSRMEITFKPDKKIFGEACFDEKILQAWLGAEKTKMGQNINPY